MGEDLQTRHPSDEMLELYLLDRLAEPQLIAVDEHLLVCDRCQDALNADVKYVAAMKKECGRRLAANPSPFHRFVQPRMRPLWTAIAACALLAVALPLYRSATAPPDPEVEVALIASRGLEAGPAVVPAGRPFILRIDLAQLPAYPSYHATIVSSSGSDIWEDQLYPISGRLAIQSAKKLSPGTYWVRLTAPDGGAIREFSLDVK